MRRQCLNVRLGVQDHLSISMCRIWARTVFELFKAPFFIYPLYYDEREALWEKGGKEAKFLSWPEAKDKGGFRSIWKRWVVWKEELPWSMKVVCQSKTFLYLCKVWYPAIRFYLVFEWVSCHPRSPFWSEDDGNHQAGLARSVQERQPAKLGKFSFSLRVEEESGGFSPSLEKG